MPRENYQKLDFSPAEGRTFFCQKCRKYLQIKKIRQHNSGRDIFVCPACHTELRQEAASVQSKNKAWQELWGQPDREQEQLKAVFADNSKKQTHFCRDCQHSFLNAFACCCTLSGQEVDPMADCPHFAARSKDTT